MMNIKRVLLVLALSLLAHREAYSDVLWWMIGSDYQNIIGKNEKTGETMTAGQLGVTDVRVRYDGSDGTSGYLTLFGVNQDGSVSVYDGSLKMGGEHGVGLPAEYFADLGSLSPQDYSFVIELGNWDNGMWSNTAMVSESRTYEELVSLNHIKEWQNTVPTYGQAWTPGNFTVVPEPTSAILVVFGASLLALRRRRRFAGFAVACVFLSGSIFAAGLDDSCVSFSTQGPDRYADGSVVLDGECYALVWSADGEFNGFSADGSCVDGEDRVVLLAPVARGGRCPPVLFQISAEIYKELSGGVLAVICSIRAFPRRAGWRRAAPSAESWSFSTATARFPHRWPPRGTAWTASRPKPIRTRGRRLHRSPAPGRIAPSPASRRCASRATTFISRSRISKAICAFTPEAMSAPRRAPARRWKVPALRRMSFWSRPKKAGAVFTRWSAAQPTDDKQEGSSHGSKNQSIQGRDRGDA